MLDDVLIHSTLCGGARLSPRHAARLAESERLARKRQHAGHAEVVGQHVKQAELPADRAALSRWDREPAKLQAGPARTASRL
eukprot:1800147-Pleurochrysis_carterae.AAC.2